MGRMQRIGAMAVVAVLGIGMAACGDDDDPEAGDDTTTTEAPDENSDAGDLDFAGDCAEFSEAFANAGTAISSALTGAEDDLDDIADYFEAATEGMPDEIKGDFEVFAEAFTDFARAMADADIDMSNPSEMDPEALERLQEISEEFSNTEVQEASNNIQAYIASNCEG